jgi:hypothetical protein
MEARDPRTLEFVRSVMKDMKTGETHPEVEAMLVDFVVGLSRQLGHRSEALRLHLSAKSVSEGIARAACAMVEHEAFEPGLSLEDQQAEAAILNSRPLPMTFSPAVVLPPTGMRTTNKEYEVSHARPKPVPASSPVVEAFGQPVVFDSSASSAPHSSSSSSGRGATVQDHHDQSGVGVDGDDGEEGVAAVDVDELPPSPPSDGNNSPPSPPPF